MTKGKEIGILHLSPVTDLPNLSLEDTATTKADILNVLKSIDDYSHILKKAKKTCLSKNHITSLAKKQGFPAHIVTQRYEEFFMGYMFALATLKNICTNQIEEHIHIPEMNTPPRSRHDIILDTKAAFHTITRYHKNLVEILTTLSPSNAIVQKAGKQ